MDNSVLCEAFERKGYEVVQGKNFLEIKSLIRNKTVIAAFAILDEADSAGIDFLRSVMEYKPLTQRVAYCSNSSFELIKKAVNRSHVNYILDNPLQVKDINRVLRKVVRRYSIISKPFEKFDVLSEVTEDLLSQNEKFRLEASVDPLTQLHNRRSFDSVSKRFWENWENKDVKYSMVLLDLDHFKRVNDTYGHTAGDTVLKVIADVLKTNQRAGIDFAFRYGGEEFALLSSSATLKEMHLYVLRLLNIIRGINIKVSPNEKIRVTASAGVACSDTCSSPYELTEQADEALYKAKENGRDQAVKFSS